MEDLGPLIAYLALPPGTPVYDCEGGNVGVVEQVLADEAVDIFHGLIVRKPPNRHLFADRDQIGELHERGVLLSCRGDELHDPSEDAAADLAVDGSEGSVVYARRRHVQEWIRQHR